MGTVPLLHSACFSFNTSSVQLQQQKAVASFPVGPVFASTSTFALGLRHLQPSQMQRAPPDNRNYVERNDRPYTDQESLDWLTSSGMGLSNFTSYWIITAAPTHI